MTLFTTGNFAINTTTDAGFKLDVNGTTRINTTGNALTNNTIGCQNTAVGHTALLNNTTGINNTAVGFR